MTLDEADAFGWDVVAALAPFVMFVAVLLLGFALLREVTR